LRSTPPTPHCFFPADAECWSGDQVTLDVEVVVDGGMGGEEALSRSSGLEALHFSLSPTDRLMRVFSPIVLPQTLLMLR